MLINIFALALSFYLLSTTGAASIHEPSAIASFNESTKNPPVICNENTQCGWVVYQPFVRNIQYHFKNTCECHPSQVCVRVSDHLSMNMYVYRCKIRPQVNTSNTPPII